MGESSRWDRVIALLRFGLARLAIKLCGLPVLYWTAPEEWERYLGTTVSILTEGDAP